MDIHDYLYWVNGVLPLAGSKSFIRGNVNDGLAHVRMAYGKFGMGGTRYVYKLGDFTYFPDITHT
jgi:hypothetical protein|tara:strand:- start:939 stop:1133 length:195 start_codon:yes stop_codon:yes gene_type:complete